MGGIRIVSRVHGARPGGCRRSGAFPLGTGGCREPPAFKYRNSGVTN